jgi:magnesium chelatase subunit H
MPKHTSAAEQTPVRVVIVTLDSHLASATERARPMLEQEIPGLSLSLHAAAEWEGAREGLQHCYEGNSHGQICDRCAEVGSCALHRCRADIAKADIVVASMLFMDDHIKAVCRRCRPVATIATPWSAACPPARSCA